MNRNCASFEKLNLKIFQFLIEEFNCKIISTERDTNGCYITYKNATTGLRISLEPREGGISILLYRLINGEIPSYEIAIKSETKINSFYLDDVISIKGGLSIRQDIDRLFKYEEKIIEDLLQQYAYALKAYATDILNGDFQIFNKLENIIKDRVKKYE